MMRLKSSSESRVRSAPAASPAVNHMPPSPDKLQNPAPSLDTSNEIFFNVKK